MASVDWADLNIDGRRLKRIIADMDHKQAKIIHKWKDTSPTQDDITLYFAYIDRIIKATNTKAGLAEIVLNIKRTLLELRKVATPPIIDGTA